MAVDRHLDWDGCCNVRDLGGIGTIVDLRNDEERQDAASWSTAASAVTAPGW